MRAAPEHRAPSPVRRWAIPLVIGLGLFGLFAWRLASVTVRWQGLSADERDVFPIADLPADAVQFTEVHTQAELLSRSATLAVPIAVVCVGLLVYLRRRRGLRIRKPGILLGVVLGLAMTVPHELIHAAFFPSGATVFVGLIQNSFSAYAASTAPMTQAQFVVMSLMPIVVLGVVPFAAFLVTVRDNAWHTAALWAFALFGLIGGTPDVLNVATIVAQMPPGTVLQMSGFHAYWYPV